MNNKFNELKENFLNYHGRLNRKAFIINSAILGACNSASSFVGSMLLEMDSIVLSLLSIVFFLAAMAFSIANIMVYIRRVHYLNKSGWFALLMLVPVVNFAVLLYVMCKRGTEGDNQYGSDPLAITC